MAGPTSVTELADRVGTILGVPVAAEVDAEGGLDVGAAVHVERNDTTAYRHPFVVVIMTGESAAAQGRLVFDRLAADTPWALELLSAGYATIDERPAVSRAG